MPLPPFATTTPQAFIVTSRPATSTGPRSSPPTSTGTHGSPAHIRQVGAGGTRLRGFRMLVSHVHFWSCLPDPSRLAVPL